MVTSVDEKGFPVLELSVSVPTKSGNPFHNPASGKFSFAPPGVVILIGSELLEGISSNARKLIFERCEMANANQLAARLIDGKLRIVILRDGKRLDSFDIKPKDERSGQGQEPDSEGKKGQELTQQMSDIIHVAARQLDLEGGELIKFMEEKLGIEISEELKEQILEMVQKQRLEDLIGYLHDQLRVRVDGEKIPDAAVRIRVGRGYLRKTFSRLDEEQTQIVLTRLQGMGWSPEVLQSSIVKGMPKRLRSKFEKDSTVDDEGKKQISERRRKK